MNTVMQTIVKDNAILLVQHHKKHCDGANCNISISLIAAPLTMAGIELTDKERLEFI